MRVRSLVNGVCVAACAATAWSCGGQSSSLAPTSVSSLSSPGALRDYYDDDPTPGAGPVAPNPGPIPDPGMPLPAPMPGDPTLPPLPLTIDIVGTFGTIAFTPNPMPALAVGNMVVWKNSDVRPHHIELEDGTVIGTMAPGEASLPIALMAETINYHCTIHPSMTGSITVTPPFDPNMPAPGTPVPPGVGEPFPAPIPMPEPPPGDGYYGGYGPYRRR